MNSICLNSQDQTQTIKESVAISGLSVRSITSENYVREFNATDFSKSLSLSSFVFLDEVFTDDGSFNDQVANDGIFTSINSYQHNSDVEFDKNLKSRIISNSVLTTTSFKYDDEIGVIHFRKEGDGGGLIGVKVEADICFCGCERCSCLACSWWEGPGCWYFCDGSIHIEIGFGW